MSIWRRLAVTVGISLGLGILATVPVITSENGYVAGYVYLPLLMLIAVACVLLFIIGFALLFLERPVGLCFLLGMILLPTGFFGSALVAKSLELGAYREEPMVSLIPAKGNVVLFRAGTTEEEISNFWQGTLGTSREDGRGYDSLPGMQTIMRLPAHDGHEAIAFDFFDSATVDQRGSVFSRIQSAPIVEKVLKDVPTAEYVNAPLSPANSDHPVKKMSVNSASDSK